MSLTCLQSQQERNTVSKKIDFTQVNPVSSLNLRDTQPGDQIISYIPGDVTSVRYYEIIVAPQEPLHEFEDSRGDLLLWVRDLDSNIVKQVDTATLGLTCSPDGRRTRWAVPLFPNNE